MYANAVGYILSIKVEFVMRNQSVYVAVYGEGCLKSSTSRKLKMTNETAYLNVISLESANI